MGASLAKSASLPSPPAADNWSFVRNDRPRTLQLRPRRARPHRLGCLAAPETVTLVGESFTTRGPSIAK